MINRKWPYILLFVVVSCVTSEATWEYDVNYTLELLNSTSTYNDARQPNSVASVAVIQIYKPKEKTNRVWSLSALKLQPLVGELRQKESIVSFFQSFQKNTNHIQGCSITTDSTVVHIVASDSTRKRLAYFRYYLCSVDGAKYGIIRTLGDEGLWYNTSPPAFITDKLKW